ncbi:MAG: hypothetical protein IPN86_07960 [Saprospiraceae bacterium]|nr:hypothetical protein [Saprospiraceae bacterium]
MSTGATAWDTTLLRLRYLPTAVIQYRTIVHLIEIQIMTVVVPLVHQSKMMLF